MMRLSPISLLLLFVAVGVCQTPPNQMPAGDKKMIQSTQEQPSEEALRRKLRSEAILKSEGVPVNPMLPVIETEAESKQRTKEVVAFRAMALIMVAVKGQDMEQSEVDKLVAAYGLEKYFSPKERAFIHDPAPSSKLRIQFGWRFESACTLFWALGFVDKLGKPEDECDPFELFSLMKKGDARKFIADARMRPLGAILDQADLIYRYHWAVVEAATHSQSAPAGLSPDVTMERHHALNWLIGYMNQEWDDVSTDT